MSSDLRQFTRIPTTLPVRLVTDDGPREGVTRDVAMKGLFVSGAGHLPADTRVTVEILLDAGVVIRADATAVRSQAEGIALRIDSLEGVESYEHLQRLVLLNSPDAAAADRIEQELRGHQGIVRRDGP